MAFETKEEVFERVICQEKPKCPHCGKTMSLWEVPDMSMDDGLGWGEPYMFMCFNDECPLYSGGWDEMAENYGRTSSFRCLCYPSSGNFECTPVWGPTGGQGQIIDDKVLAEREQLQERINSGLARLDECKANSDGAGALEILLNASEPARIRTHAAELLGEIGGLEAIDPLVNHKFGNHVLQKKVKEAIESIHARNFTRECPFCAEIIKKKAKICKHCGQELSTH